MDQPPPSTFPPSSREHPSFIMQASPALSKLEALYNEIMLSSSSTRDARTTLCLRDADQIYLYPQTPAGTRLMKGVRPVGYNVAIKTYPPAIRSLLIHSYVDCSLHDVVKHTEQVSSEEITRRWPFSRTIPYFPLSTMQRTCIKLRPTMLRSWYVPLTSILSYLYSLAVLHIFSETRKR